jgi:Fe2+ or Zn2+ uptake regulation protein
LVLNEILFLYPETLTFDELVREVSKGSTDFASRDGVHRAVRELTGAGLLHRVDALVLPTRAACCFDDYSRLP